MNYQWVQYVLPANSDGPHCMDSLSRELSSKTAVERGGIRQPPQMDEEDRNKPHPVSVCQGLGESVPGCNA